MKATLVGLVFLTLVVYWPTRHASFVYEDDVYVRPAQQGLVLTELVKPRGLTMATFRLNAWLGGTDPAGYHTANVSLHILVGLSVFAVTRLLLPLPFALLATALALLHPLASESVAYVAGRAELIAALGTLWAVWAALQTPFRPRHAAVLVLGVVVAVGGKDLGIMALPLAGWVRWTQHRPAWSWRLGGLVLLGSLLFLALTWRVVASRLIGNEYLLVSPRVGLAYAAIQSVALWNLLAIAIVPATQTVDHDYDFVTQFGWRVSLVMSLLVTMWMWMGRRRWPMVWLGIGWMLMTAAPRFIIPLSEYLNEHQVYVPFLGLWIAFAAVVAEFQDTRVARDAPEFCEGDGVAEASP